MKPKIVTESLTNLQRNLNQNKLKAKKKKKKSKTFQATEFNLQRNQNK